MTSRETSGESLGAGRRQGSRSGSRPGSRASSLRASRSGSIGSRRGGSGASSSGGSRRGSLASVASSVRSSIDSFAMGAMGIGAEERAIIAQEEQSGARPCRAPGVNGMRCLMRRLLPVRCAVPAGDSPICSDMVLQMLLYFHVHFSIVWFAMYWYLWSWKVSAACLVFLPNAFLAAFVSGCSSHVGLWPVLSLLDAYYRLRTWSTSER